MKEKEQGTEATPKGGGSIITMASERAKLVCIGDPQSQQACCADQGSVRGRHLQHKARKLDHT